MSSSHWGDVRRGKARFLTRHLPLLAAALALGSGCAAPPAERSAGERRMLPHAECLDPVRARGWALIDSDELLVDAGRRRYHLQLARSCPDVATAMAIHFRGGGLGRVCGGPTDAVIAKARTPASQPCPITAVTPLSEQEYQRYLGDGDLELRALEGDRPPGD